MQSAEVASTKNFNNSFLRLFRLKHGIQLCRHHARYPSFSFNQIWSGKKIVGIKIVDAETNGKVRVSSYTEVSFSLYWTYCY